LNDIFDVFEKIPSFRKSLYCLWDFEGILELFVLKIL